MAPLPFSTESAAPPRALRPPPSGRLAALGAEHAPPLWAIVADPGVMEWVGDTRPWGPEKLARFLRYCAQDRPLAAAPAPPGGGESRFLYWGVFLAEGLAGVVGVHPIAYDPEARGRAFLTIFLARWAQGRGEGERAARAALAAHWALAPRAPVWLDARAGNSPMVALAGRLGFVPDPSPVRRQRRRRYLRFVCRPPEGGGLTASPRDLRSRRVGDEVSQQRPGGAGGAEPHEN